MFWFLNILLLYTNVWIPIVSSNPFPKPKPKPFIEPLTTAGSEAVAHVSAGVHDALIKISATTGKVYGIISRHTPFITEEIMENSVKVAVNDPVLTGPLTRRIGKFGAEAFIQGRENGMILVRAANEGMWEVFSQAIKEYFASLGSKLSSIANHFKSSVLSKIPGLAKFIPPEIEVATVFETANTPKTWAQHFSDSFTKLRANLAPLENKAIDIYEKVFHVSLRTSAKIATLNSQTKKMFGSTTDKFAEQFVKDAEFQRPIAKEYGRVVAQEFLKNPASAATALYDLSKGAVPVLYEKYTLQFSVFVKEMSLLAAAVPLKAFTILKELAEKILADMKALLSGSKQKDSELVSSATDEVESVMVNNDVSLSTDSEVSKIGSVIGKEIKNMQRKLIPKEQMRILLKRDYDLSDYDNVTPENEPLLRDLQDVIQQFEKLGYLLYYGTASYDSVPI